jgi:uncharacterized protein
MTALRLLQIKVKPNARESMLTELDDGSWTASLKAPPVDGKANRELIDLVASHFGVQKVRVKIKHGGAGRVKHVTVES